MDRMIHTALNSVKNMYDERNRIAHNLSMVAVPGFRRDMSNDGGSRNLQADGTASSRSFAVEMGPAGFSDQSGTMVRTDMDTDVAIVGEGYFYVQPGSGAVALSRRGDMAVRVDGTLVNGVNEPILDNALQPINVPPFREMQISKGGEILVSPLAEDPGVFQSVGFLGTTTAADEVLRKGLDSHIRRPDGTVPQPTGGVVIAQSTLEGANVNPVDELIGSLEIQRQFEISIRFIKIAEEIDRGGAEVMRMPEG